MCIRDRSKSTYYFELNKVDLVDKRNTELKDEIQKIFTEHKGRYGVRRVYRELLNRGFVVNHKRVQRLMHCMGPVSYTHLDVYKRQCYGNGPRNLKRILHR